MDRSLEIRKTGFVIPELYISGEMLDKIQCKSFQLLIRDTSPFSVCFHLAINMRPTLVYGADDLGTLSNQNSNFEKLILKDENMIRKIIRFFELNPTWRKYSLTIQFAFASHESEQFPCEIIPENDHLLIFKRI